MLTGFIFIAYVQGAYASSWPNISTNVKTSSNANTVDNAANINKVIWNYAGNPAQLKNVQRAQTVMDSLYLQ